MKKNDLIELTIEDMGTNGEGIGKAGTFPFFIKDAVIGDRIVARILKLKKQYGFARVEEILEPSAKRVAPLCENARRCGGCQIQELEYEEQVAWKKNKVSNQLIRIGGFSPELIEDIMEDAIASQRPFRYRNKMVVPFGTDKDGKTVAGFYAGRTHHIIPCTDCLLGAEVNAQILSCVLKHMQTYGIRPYDETTGKGLVRHLLTRIGEETGQIMVCLILNGNALPQEEVLVKALSKIDGIASIMINVNTENTNVILGSETRVLWGQDHITDILCGIRFEISPLSFYQVNHDQAQKLYERALDYAQLTGSETVWDLYCGIGTITLALSKQAGSVYGVEIVPRAIEDAKLNAKINDITNAHFYVGKAEDVFAEKMEESGGALKPDVVVVDPPRKGCDEKLLQTMLQMAPDRIVYVSCDSATLARDLKILCESAYELKKVTVVDQFSQSSHVETVCLLSKLHEAKHHVNVTVDMDEMDLTKAESKATYKEIEEYVMERTGLHVTNLNIAQVKAKHG
ncbi:MAG: 23S rRNA (uracil(1939)-C(5))-methyltransferase RlmD, partial [Eubacteriales bacterium]|nr:23S rRNA (uracil(1939)-C(5))-methyltransferase RlmD [Eubacteriales bacterium]